jgi:hypothetical protein
MKEAGPFQIIPYFMGGAPKLTLFVSTSNNHGSACLYCTTYVEHTDYIGLGLAKLAAAAHIIN